MAQYDTTMNQLFEESEELIFRSAVTISETDILIRQSQRLIRGYRWAMPAASAQEDRPKLGDHYDNGAWGRIDLKNRSLPWHPRKLIHKPFDRPSLVGTFKQILETQPQHSVRALMPFSVRKFGLSTKFTHLYRLSPLLIGPVMWLARNLNGHKCQQRLPRRNPIAR